MARPPSDKIPPQYSQLFNSIGTPLLLFQGGKNIAAANPAACQMYGKPESALLACSIWDLIAPGNQERIEAEYKADPNSPNFVQQLGADGKLLDVSIKVSELDLGGQHYFCAAITDLSELLVAQRQNEALAANLKTALEGAQLGSWQWNIQTGQLIINDRWAGILGYTLKELNPVTIQTWQKFTQPDDYARANTQLQALFSGTADLYEEEIRMQHKNGQWVWVFTRGSITERDADGKPLWMSGTHTDITDRKQAQADAETSHQVLAQFSEQLPGMLYQFKIEPNGNGSMPYISGHVTEMFGCTAEEVRDDYAPLLRYVLPEDGEKLLELITQCVQNNSDFQDTVRVAQPGQPVRHIFARATPVRQPNGDVVFYGYANDVSENIALALEKATVEDRFTRMFDNMSEGIILVDKDWKITFINKGAENLRSIRRENLVGKHLLEVNPVRLSKESVELRKRVMRTRKPEIERMPIYQDDGSVHWAERNVQPSGDGILIIDRDITDEVNAQHALAESEERYQQLAENSPDVIYTVNTNTERIEYCNRPDFFGYSLEEVNESKSGTHVHPLDHPGLIAATENLMRTGTPTDVELRMRMPNGRYRWLRHRQRMLHPGLRLVNLTDIDDAKQAQAALQQSETKFAAIFHNIRDAVGITRAIDNCYVEVNESFCNLVGTTRDKILGTNTLVLGIWKDQSQRTIFLNQLLKEGSVTRFETEYKNLRGQEGWIEISANGIELGGEAYWLITGHDVTDRKRAEQAMARSERRFRSLFEGTIDGQVNVDMNHNLLMANHAMARMLGYTDEELKDLNHTQVTDPTTQAFKEITAEVGDLGAARGEHTLTQKDGSVLPIEYSATLLYDDADQPFVSVSVRDISNIARLKNDLQTFLDVVPDMMCVVNAAQGSFMQVNRAWQTNLGYAEAEMVDKTIVEFVHPDDLERTATKVAEMMSGDTATNFINRYRAKDGAYHWLEWEAMPSPDGRFIYGAARDITERLVSEQALAASEQRFRSLFESTIDGLALLDEQDHVIMANLALKEMLGYPEEAWETLSMKDVLLDLPGVMSLAAPQLDQQGYARGTADVRRANGEILRVEFTATLIPHEGTETYTNLAIRDITAITKARDDLQRFFDLVPDMVSVADTHTGKFVQLNPAWQAALGYSTEELLSRPLTDFIHPDDVAHTLQTRQQHATHEPMRKFVNRYIAKDGSSHYLEWDTTPSPDGQFVYGAARDITERLEREQELHEAETRFNQAFRNGPIAINIFDPITYTPVDCNEAFEHLVGATREEVLAQSIRSFGLGFSGPVRKVWQKKLEANGIIPNVEHNITNRLGVEKHLLGSYVRLEVHGRKLAMLLLVDMTAQKAAERIVRAANEDLEQRVAERTAQLEQTNQALERANKTKDEFLSAVSHELRTPLTGVLGLSQVLQMPNLGQLNEKQQNAVANIEKNGQRLLNTINDMITYTQLLGDSIKPDPRDSSVDMICSLSMRGVETAARAKNISLVYNNPSGVGMFRVDERLLRNVLANLLGNAVKFGVENGQAGLDVEPSPDGHTLHLTVWDTGIGIKPDDLPKLFHPFMQLDARLARAYEGTGLGLAIVKQTMRLLGGDVTITSELGAGTRVTLTLPLG